MSADGIVSGIKSLLYEPLIWRFNLMMFIGLGLHWFDISSDVDYQRNVPFANVHLQRAQLAFIILPFAFLLQIGCDTCFRVHVAGKRFN